MTGRSRRAMLPGLAVLVFALTVLALFAGLVPLVMPLGWAAGGVLDTGQAEPLRWWLAVVIVLGTYLMLTWRIPGLPRLWWLGVLVSGILVAVGLFCWRASLGQPDFSLGGNVRPPSTVKTGIMSALPLFWPEGQAPEAMIAQKGAAARSPSVELLNARAVDAIDDATLAGLDGIVLIQPRLLRPEELATLDRWLEIGGKAVIFADPLLMWPSHLPLGDPRRPPLTSLLDPLLTHWGLRLEPVGEDGPVVERRMISTGHVLMLAGASQFTLTRTGNGNSRCALGEQGLMALCRIGAGKVRLIADADVIDDRLWLADRRWPERSAAYSSDIVSLLQAWTADPVQPAGDAPPRRVMSNGALTIAMRIALGAVILWVGLGWFGQSRLLVRQSRQKDEAR